MKKMKKFILSLGLIAMAFGLTNCSKNDDLTTTKPTTSTPFELFASVTRTSNEGLNTVWKDGDDLTVFHAENGTKTFVNNGQFILDDASTGHFSGTLAGELTAESYDWYVTYPHYNGFTKPGTGYYNTIGCTKDKGKQTQSGNNSSAHLCGVGLPLIGVTKGVAAGEIPAITLKNAASFAKFIVKNKTSEAITIKSVEMTAEGYNVVGQFYIKFAEDVVAYNPKSNSTLSTALLEVKSGEAIAAGESATFYMAVAPFALTESSTVSFKVVATNASDVEFECVKNATCAAGWGFTAGQYKEISFGFEILDATIVATTADATNTESADGTTATLNGSYAITNAIGSENVTCGFEYKLSSASSYTSVTATAAPSFSYNLTGLTAGAEYAYRAWASLNGGEKQYGEEKVFTPTALAASVKSYKLTSEDMRNIGVKWGYPDTDIKTVSAADGSTWTAYQAYRGSASSTTIGVRKDNPDGYLATPVVNGNITKIIINAKSTGTSTKFALASDATSAAFYTSAALGKTTQDWSVDITNNCKQIFIHSAYGTVTINAVTVYYTEE